MEERGAPLLGKARGTSENLGKETRENANDKAGYTAIQLRTVGQEQ